MAQFTLVRTVSLNSSLSILLSVIGVVPPLTYCSCTQIPSTLSGVSGVMLYRGRTKQAIIRLKKYSGKDDIELFSQYLSAAIKRDFPNVFFSVVTAVPLYRKKERRRGFNQAKRLAQATAIQLGLPYSDTLIKVRSTEDQHTLHAAERQWNLTSAFEPIQPISGSILLIDDVRTTGATLNECAQTLLSAGASQVFAACLALSCFSRKKANKKAPL